jgi:hypothetical protein
VYTGFNFSGGFMTDLDRHFYRDKIVQRPGFVKKNLWHLIWLIPLISVFSGIQFWAIQEKKIYSNPRSMAYVSAQLESIRTGQQIYPGFITDKATGLKYRAYLVGDDIFPENDPLTK